MASSTTAAFRPRRLLITGASSGIGLAAARCLAAQGHALTLFCSSQARCDQTRVQLEQAGAAPGSLTCLAVDLADLASVEAGCRRLLDQGAVFDALVLNAGQQRAGDATPVLSAQGLEITFAVNQLAHQLIATRLLPLLAPAAEGAVVGRLVITASDVHNPATGGGRVGQPAHFVNLAGLRRGPGFVMLDGSERFDGDKAYKDSKLCNVLLAREINRQQGGCLPVIAWSPGLVIPRSPDGFFRHNRRSNPLGMALFALVARDLLRLTESVERAGALLADARYAAPGFRYFSNQLVRPGLHRFGAVETSAAGADPAQAAALWQLSEGLIAEAAASRPAVA